MSSIKVFVSYSWDSESHKEWTLCLASKLEEYFEIDVAFDQYDLDSFEDKNHFMERGVFDNEYIVVVVTPSYVDKANDRAGGVGIESKMTSAKHWDESLITGKSKIIPVLREGDELPNYLKEKIYIDFRDDLRFEGNFDLLVKHFKGSVKALRPEKNKSIDDKPMHKDLTKIEDFLKINHKKRRLVFDKTETTDYSSGNRIKFELWETKSPAIDYYLFVFDGVILKPTVKRVCELIKRDEIVIKRLTVLRSSKGERGYIKKTF